MSGLIVDQDACVGCRKCVRACTSHGIEVVERKARPTEGCTLCGICVDACPVGAISIERNSDLQAVDLSSYHGVWVIAQQQDANVASVTYELLGKGRELADTRGCDLTVLMPGDSRLSNPEIAQQLIAYGADRVIRCIDKRLAWLDAGLIATWVYGLVQQYLPEIILIGATNFGRELAPHISSSLHCGLTADCTVLAIDPQTGLLQQTRPAFGGNLMATIVCPNHRPQMATVRPGVMPVLEADLTRTGAVVDVALDIRAKPSVNLIERIPQNNLDSITEAQALVVVGRGIGSKKNLPLMKHFADLLGAKLGCSRPLVESGWCEYPLQVGQTGVSVSPKLLISVGVSGAIQHLAGIGGAQTIIAINSDPSAPIFDVSQYSVVGDCVEIVQEAVQQLEWSVSSR